MFCNGFSNTKLEICPNCVKGIETIVIMIREYNKIVNVWVPLSIDFLEEIVYTAQNNADPIPLIRPMLDIEAILSSRSPVASMHPISTRITEMILIEVIFSLNVKYSIINTKTGAVLSKTAARDNGTVFIELL